MLAFSHFKLLSVTYEAVSMRDTLGLRVACGSVGRSRLLGGHHLLPLAQEQRHSSRWTTPIICSAASTRLAGEQQFRNNRIRWYWVW